MNQRVKMKVDGIAKMVTLAERDRILAERASDAATVQQLRESVSNLTDRNCYLESSRKAEYDGRLKAVGDIAKLIEMARNATDEALAARNERDSTMRQLAFAQGFIAALKGEPYREMPTNDLGTIFGRQS